MPVLQATETLQRSIQENSGLLAKYDPEQVIQLMDQVQGDKPYHYITSKVAAIWRNLVQEFGKEGFEAYQRLLMLHLIADFDHRASGKSYTDDIRRRFETSFRRILLSLEDTSFEYYRARTDILLKDLAICRQKLKPTGACVIERSSYHRALMFRAGLQQAIQVLKALIECGGNGPFYEIHTHVSELTEYDREGWDRSYLRMAELLELNPEVKGVWGGSWFYDPEIARVSPRLAYLRERPEQNGAYVFYSNVDINGGALATSKTRRDLYERGEYLPKSYVIIWPRAKILAWARQETNKVLSHDLQLA